MRKRGSKLTLWTVADVTRDRERQENIFQELQHAIDYLDHAPAGFFSVDADGDIVYLNATLAAWLDHDLAQVGSGGLKLADIVSGDGAALLTTLAARAGRGQDRDASTSTSRPAAAAPCRCGCSTRSRSAPTARRAPRARWCSTAPAARPTDPQRAAEVRFMRFFQKTPMAIATVDKAGRIARTNALFARLFPARARATGEGARSSPSVAERDRDALGSRDPPGRRRAERHRAGRRRA